MSTVRKEEKKTNETFNETTKSIDVFKETNTQWRQMDNGMFDDDDDNDKREEKGLFHPFPYSEKKETMCGE